MPDKETQQSERTDQGLPGSESDQNKEEPTNPEGDAARRPPGSKGEGDSSGASKEGSQSTGSPTSAG